MPLIEGTAGNDTLNGTAGDDSIYGYEGDDTLNGGDGNDALLGFEGNDILNGDAGNDTLYAGLGDDTANGGSGNDWIVGDPGLDIMHGGDGDDVFQIRSTTDAVVGEVIDGGAGYDTVSVGGSILYGPVDLTVAQLIGIEAIKAWSFNDEMVITPAQLAGLSEVEGNFILASGGPITLAGVTVNASFRLSDTATVFDATGAIKATAESLFAVHGGAGGDTITGNEDANSLYGADGDDVIHGAGGGDNLTGGLGVDLIYGDAGDDYFNVYDSSYIEAGEVIDGGAGFDRLYTYASGTYDFTGITLSGIEQLSNASNYFVDAFVTNAQFAMLTTIDLRMHLDAGGAVSLAGKSFGANSAVYLAAAHSTVTMAGIVSGSPQIVGSTGNDAITGSDLADTLSGGGGNDTLIGGGGNDVLRSGTGVDNLDGGPGDDRLFVEDVDMAGDQYSGGDGYDTLVVASLDISGLALTGIERVEGTYVSMTAAQADALSVLQAYSLTLTTGGAVSLSGTAPASYTLAAAGNTLDLSGVTSISSFSVTGGAGADTVIGRDLFGYTDHLYGNGGDDVLEGLAGDDYFIGGPGNDTMIGGPGNDLMFGEMGDDTYYVDSADDYLSEAIGAGANDRVFASVSYTLAAGVEVERLATTDAGAATAINLTGNAFANIVVGDAGANTLNGKAGNDTLSGLGGNDVLLGEDGDDALDGGAGSDTMTGGAGNDTYWVDDAADSVSEASGQGSDRVIASVGYALAAGQHVELLSTISDAGTAAIDLTGNELAQTITGNAGVNVLIGLGGNDVLDGLGGDDIVSGGAGDDIVRGGTGGDTLDGGADFDMLDYSTSSAGVTVSLAANSASGGDAAGDVISNFEGVYGSSLNDTLIGGAGNDTLDGGTGADWMAGGAGNDTYVVDDDGDTVSEAGGEGTDTVEASATFTLGANVENLTLTGGEALKGTGNDAANVLTGNGGANVLDGGAGGDRLVGGDGQDWLQGGEGHDIETGGTGHDSVWGGAGNDVLDGGAGDDTIVGNEGADAVTYALAGSGVEVDLSWIEVQDTRGGGWDTLVSIENVFGSAFDDRLTGDDAANQFRAGTGADVLTGGGGNDLFVYAALDSTVAAPDLITDFAAGDRVHLGLIDADAATPGDQAFHLGATAGHTGDIVLAFDAGNNRTSVSLFVDGDALADGVIWLSGDHTSLTAADFVL